MSTLFSLSSEIHWCIAEFLTPHECHNVSQLSARIQEVYRRNSFRYVTVSINDKPKLTTKTGKQYREVPLEVLFNPKRYGWFRPSFVKEVEIGLYNFVEQRHTQFSSLQKQDISTYNSLQTISIKPYHFSCAHLLRIINTKLYDRLLSLIPSETKFYVESLVDMFCFDPSIADGQAQRFNIQKLEIIDLFLPSRLNYHLFPNIRYLSLGTILSAPFYRILFSPSTKTYWTNLQTINVKHYFSYNPFSPNWWNVEASIFSLIDVHVPPVESFSLRLFIRHVETISDPLPNMQTTAGLTIPKITEIFVANTDLDEFLDLMKSFHFPNLRHTHLEMDNLSYSRLTKSNFLTKVTSLEIGYEAINQLLKGMSPVAFSFLPNVTRLSINLPELNVTTNRFYYEYMRKISALYYTTQENIFEPGYLSKVADTTFSIDERSDAERLIKCISSPLDTSLIEVSNEVIDKRCFLERFFYLIGQNLTRVQYISIMCHSYQFFPSLHFEHTLNRLTSLKQVLVYLEDNKTSLQGNGITSNAVSFYPYQQESFYSSTIDGGAKTRYISLIGISDKQKYAFNSSDYLLSLYQNNNMSRAKFNGWY